MEQGHPSPPIGRSESGEMDASSSAADSIVHDPACNTERRQEMMTLAVSNWRFRTVILPLLAGLPVFASSFSTARADLLYFRKGGQVQANALVEENRVVIELPGATYNFQRDDFLKLVPGFSPDKEWARRRQEARSADFAARYAAVWWAIENGLAVEAATEIRELHRLDPNHARRPGWPPRSTVSIVPAGNRNSSPFAAHWESRPRLPAGLMSFSFMSVPTPRRPSASPSLSA